MNKPAKPAFDPMDVPARIGSSYPPQFQDVSGELTLITDAGEQVLTPGMCAAFPKNKPDAHCLVNRSDAPASYLEIGDRTPGDQVNYPGLDLKVDWVDGDHQFQKKDGTPY